jgi:hypothetical protein
MRTLASTARARPSTMPARPGSVSVAWRRLITAMVMTRFRSSPMLAMMPKSA